MLTEHHQEGKKTASMAPLVRCYSAKQKVASLIPSQGTYPGCEFGPQMGMYERQLISVSLSH